MTAAQRQFAVTHLGLAHQQARRFAIRHQLDFEEVLGAADEGLCKAAVGFDPSLGFRPSSYVVPKVKGELLHHLCDSGFVVRICHCYGELWIKARRCWACRWGCGWMCESLVGWCRWLGTTWRL
ncbi:MAG: sigma factor [Cyanobacteriota bacterium]|nr:sigma factor [Cyanobacteriota bacterium]